MSSAKKISYALFAGAIVLTIYLRLGSVLLAGLASYMILEATHRSISAKVSEFFRRWLSVLIFLLTALVVAWLFWIFVKLSLARLPVILSDAIPRIVTLATDYSLNLPFDNPQDLRTLILDAARQNARSITLESFVVTKEFFQVLLAIFVAILRFLEGNRLLGGRTLFDAVYAEFTERMTFFMEEFEKVIGAQVVISAVNTLFTALLLITFQLHFFKFLTLSTFMLGVLPIVGNFISNILIAGTALMLSPQKAVIVLIALAILHKCEYFLNSHIISTRVDLPFWQTLLGILLGEILLGIPGIILAPTFIAHVRREMREIPHHSK